MLRDTVYDCTLDDVLATVVGFGHIGMLEQVTCPNTVYDYFVRKAFRICISG